jgi:hypothetical protein
MKSGASSVGAEKKERGTLADLSESEGFYGSLKKALPILV